MRFACGCLFARTTDFSGASAVPSSTYTLVHREMLTPLSADGRSYNVRLVFEAAPMQPELFVKPGNYVRVEAVVDGRQVIRSYTPQPTESGLVLMVKVGVSKRRSW
jgi:hypothetical protein